MEHLAAHGDWEYCGALGQDSHRFMTAGERSADPARILMLGGLAWPDEMPLAGNSDADVILHALTNAISGLTGRNILGARADELCLKQGITDSAVYLRESLADLAASGWLLCHISFAVEGQRPHFANRIAELRQRLAGLTGLAGEHIGLTATSGEGLTSFGRGEGLQVLCQITAKRKLIG